MSCGSRQDLTPGALVERAQPLPVIITKPAESKFLKEASQPEIQEKTVTKNPKKSLAGEVTFSGVSSVQLDLFRVIPEFGGSVFSPSNRHYHQVDGFWWKGDRDHWFKIPDHGEAWVVGESGKAPANFDGTSKNNGFQVYWKSIPAFRWASAMKGGVKEPGWYPNAGKSRIGIAYPF